MRIIVQKTKGQDWFNSFDRTNISLNEKRKFGEGLAYTEKIVRKAGWPTRFLGDYTEKTAGIGKQGKEIIATAGQAAKKGALVIGGAAATGIAGKITYDQLFKGNTRKESDAPPTKRGKFSYIDNLIYL